MTHPLYVAIIWHMHQPFYRDLRAGEISLDRKSTRLNSSHT